MIHGFEYNCVFYCRQSQFAQRIETKKYACFDDKYFHEWLRDTDERDSMVTPSTLVICLDLCVRVLKFCIAVFFGGRNNYDDNVETLIGYNGE